MTSRQPPPASQVLAELRAGRCEHGDVLTVPPRCPLCVPPNRPSANRRPARPDGTSPNLRPRRRSSSSSPASTTTRERAMGGTSDQPGMLCAVPAQPRPPADQAGIPTR